MTRRNPFSPPPWPLADRSDRWQTRSRALFEILAPDTGDLESEVAAVDARRCLEAWRYRAAERALGDGTGALRAERVHLRRPQSGHRATAAPVLDLGDDHRLLAGALLGG